MNNLKDIHNLLVEICLVIIVVLSGFQWTIWRIYTTARTLPPQHDRLFYQDFNEQFEGYTQPPLDMFVMEDGCFIRISMNNLKDIHNIIAVNVGWYLLFYQDFNEQFEGYTQPWNSSFKVFGCCFIRISMNNLKDIHNAIRRLFIF